MATSKKMSPEAKRKAREYRRASRALYFAGTRLILMAFGLALCLGVTVSCFRLANTYIVINEGMSLRAEYVLEGGSLTSLQGFFTDGSILADTRLKDTAYKDFDVTDFIYSLDFEKLKVWPWLSTLTFEVIETVTSITGSAEGFEGAVPPAWAPLKYRLTLVRQDGCWKIDTLTVLEVNPAQQPAATPDMSREALPMATATPAPTPTPVYYY